MENFIVRIYRRDPAGPMQLAGVVEEVGVAGKKPFHNRAELVAILEGGEGSRGSSRMPGA